ncbi:class I SAM-dependent methyltransferase [Mangrovihabitans endophyticus]|uniref:Methyltransferase domain-containing protein n=1 Tax=Mangrovihabitans endophyticus TaxID=1751298 RepID=A0A8J3BVA6_9ACTN|nr:methyltransferase domain-containing protein [Mangrovihabitans endophyticus]GGK72673.1 hypothetical protein GCM10012284_03130 [Mangrovihabitans endophyticus]
MSVPRPSRRWQPDAESPALADVIARILHRWPEHAGFVQRRFDAADRAHLRLCERLAAAIATIVADDPDVAVDNYRWTCELLLAEEYRFSITGAYRYRSFAEVAKAVYADADFMRRYTDGLLLSQLMWANHANAMQLYESRFLSRLPVGGSLLEVGPGHGLLLASAARRPAGRLTGWDVSDGSLRSTRRTLNLLGLTDVTLARHDVLHAPAGRSFDLVVASELVEHVDRPADALRRLAALTGAEGWLYLNIPVNSPAPDHITLWRTPESLFSFIADQGLEIVERHVLPMTGYTESAARAAQVTMSCVAICRGGRDPDLPRPRR